MPPHASAHSNLGGWRSHKVPEQGTRYQKSSLRFLFARPTVRQSAPVSIRTSLHPPHTAATPASAIAAAKRQEKCSETTTHKIKVSSSHSSAPRLLVVLRSSLTPHHHSAPRAAYGRTRKELSSSSPTLHPVTPLLLRRHCVPSLQLGLLLRDHLTRPPSSGKSNYRFVFTKTKRCFASRNPPAKASSQTIFLAAKNKC